MCVVLCEDSVFCCGSEGICGWRSVETYSGGSNDGGMY